MKREYLFPLQPQQVAEAAQQLLRTNIPGNKARSITPKMLACILGKSVERLGEIGAFLDDNGCLSISAQENPTGYWWLLRDCQALAALLCASAALYRRSKAHIETMKRYEAAADEIAREIVRSVLAEDTDTTTQAPSQ